MFNLLDFCSLFALNLGKGSGSRLSADPRDSTGLAGRPGIFSDCIFRHCLYIPLWEKTLRAVFRRKNPFHNSVLRNPKFRVGNPVCFFLERYPTAIQDLSFSQCCTTKQRPFATKAATAMPWLLLFRFAFGRPLSNKVSSGFFYAIGPSRQSATLLFRNSEGRMFPPSPAGQRLFAAGRKGFPPRERARKEAGRATPGAPEA